jgi:hypothetical protein
MSESESENTLCGDDEPHFAAFEDLLFRMREDLRCVYLDDVICDMMTVADLDPAGPPQDHPPCCMVRQHHPRCSHECSNVASFFSRYRDELAILHRRHFRHLGVPLGRFVKLAHSTSTAARDIGSRAK